MADSLDRIEQMARVAKSARAAASSPPVADKTTFLDWFFQPLMLFRVSLIAGAFALWPYAVQRLPALGHRPEYRLTFSEITIRPLPEKNVPANLLEEVQRLAAFPDNVSILDENLAAELASAFRKHPWVANVVRVRKSFPAAIVVELEYREPVAFVAVADNQIPIDADAIVLPKQDFSVEDRNRFPMIKYAGDETAPSVGMVWNDPTLVAAARLAELLCDRWKSLKLESISAARNAEAISTIDEVQLELVAIDGSKILWGRVPGTDYPGELEPLQKVRRIENYLAEFGDYGQPNGPYEIDIRHWRENTRRPLGIDPAQAKPSKGKREPIKARQAESKKKPHG